MTRQQAKQLRAELEVVKAATSAKCPGCKRANQSLTARTVNGATKRRCPECWAKEPPQKPPTLVEKGQRVLLGARKVIVQ